MFPNSDFIINVLVITGFILIHLSSTFLLDKKGDVQAFNSFAAGVGISYAVIHLLPHLAYFQSVLIGLVFRGFIYPWHLCSCFAGVSSKLYLI